MTIYLETTQNKGNQIKGEIHKLEHIKKIVEHDEYIEYVVNDNYKTGWTKEMHRIAYITF